MTKKTSPLEFYDEELSRTIRQVQLALIAVESDNSNSSSSLANVDKLLNASRVFLHQMQMAVKELPNNNRDSSKAQWTEILSFRQDTLAILTMERAKANYKASLSSWEQQQKKIPHDNGQQHAKPPCLRNSGFL